MASREASGPSSFMRTCWTSRQMDSKLGAIVICLLLPWAGCDISPHGSRNHIDQSLSPPKLQSNPLGAPQRAASNSVRSEFHQGDNITFTKATLGRMATLKCTAKHVPGKKMVSWVRYRDVSLLAVGKFVYTSDDRFKVLHEADSDEWFLVIKSVRYDDEGVYECQINAQPTYVSYKYMLSVVEPRTEIVGERELFVDYASSINLTCLVISPDPPAYVFWRQDQKLVEVSEASRPLKHRGEDNLRIVFAQNHPRPGITQSSLLIQKANASHSGLFSCLPSNSESKSIRVHVLKDDSHPAAIHTTSSHANKLSPIDSKASRYLLLLLSSNFQHALIVALAIGLVSVCLSNP